MRSARIILGVLAIVIVAGCRKSPTAAPEQRTVTRGAAHDDAPPPPPSATGGIGGMGSGN